MASPLTHAVAGMALAAWVGPKSPPRRFWIAAALCGAIPDIDIIGWGLNIPNESIVGHRALSHSIAFALVFGALVAWAFFRDREWSRQRIRLFAAFALATATHGVLDALTTYSLGVEFFSPFSQHRYRFAWQPLTDPIDGVHRALRNELLIALLPATLAAYAGWRLRRTKAADSSSTGNPAVE